MVDDLAENLKARGYQAEGLHGDMTQKQRDFVMGRFKSGNLEILIATDVAARAAMAVRVCATAGGAVTETLENTAAKSSTVQERAITAGKGSVAEAAVIRTEAPPPRGQTAIHPPGHPDCRAGRRECCNPS